MQYFLMLLERCIVLLQVRSALFAHGQTYNALIAYAYDHDSAVIDSFGCTNKIHLIDFTGNVLCLLVMMKIGE